MGSDQAWGLKGQERQRKLMCVAAVPHNRLDHAAQEQPDVLRGPAEGAGGGPAPLVVPAGDAEDRRSCAITVAERNRAN